MATKITDSQKIKAGNIEIPKTDTNRVIKQISFHVLHAKLAKAFL
jgi:hypothetical protein